MAAGRAVPARRLPAVGGQQTWSVLHLFCHCGADVDAGSVLAALGRCQTSGQQVVTATLLGHKADLAVMALGADLAPQRALTKALRAAGCTVSFSYVSRTEVSEYAAGAPEDMREARLHPVLPPAGLASFCFYPMSKRRQGEDNWYRLPYEERLALMRDHGAIGREFRGRVLQVVTGSTGLDDWEWGVTLFGREPDDLKECVYRMRFDEASARYADFGPFLSGTVGTPSEVLDELAGR